MLWFLSYLVDTGKYTSTTLRFLESGHSFGPCDQFFGRIERRGRRDPSVVVPQDWYRICDSFDDIEIQVFDTPHFQDWRTIPRKDLMIYYVQYLLSIVTL